MPTTALKSELMVQTPARPYMLLIGGTDVIARPGGPDIGVPVESIVVREEGPGGVSSLTFECHDPTVVLGLSDGLEVAYWKGSNLRFRGRLDGSGLRPDFGIGRGYTISATGVESWLDWLRLPGAYTASVGGLNLQNAIVEVAQRNPGPLKIVTGSISYGSFDQPIGQLDQAGYGIPFLNNPATPTIASGTTLRAAIEQLAAASVYPGTAGSVPQRGAAVRATVDFFYGLRVWPAYGNALPTDYGQLVVVDTYASTQVAATLTVDTEYAEAIHEVYVEGGNAAGSGLFGDGSGIRGEQGRVVVPSSTTADLAATAAQAFFGQQANSQRPKFTLEDYSPDETIHAGSLVQLIDAQTGFNAVQPIAAIEKRFKKNGLEDWTIEAGGFALSAARQVGRNLGG